MVKLHDHTHAEAPAPRSSLLASLSFLRFLPPSPRDSLFASPSSPFCRDLYVRSDTCFLPNTSSLPPCPPPSLPGWYVIVRGSVAVDPDVEEEEAAESHILQQGSVVGYVEASLQHPSIQVPYSYTAASFVHLLYFDRALLMAEAGRRWREGEEELLRSLWWVVAALELKQEGGREGGGRGGWVAVSRISRWHNCGLFWARRRFCTSLKGDREGGREGGRVC